MFDIYNLKTASQPLHSTVASCRMVRELELFGEQEVSR